MVRGICYPMGYGRPVVGVLGTLAALAAPVDDEPSAWWSAWLDAREAPATSPLPWAFFTLKTGVPGSGKSLTLVRELQIACAGENPPLVYMHGIPDLALPYIPLPVYNPLIIVKGDDGKPMQVYSRTLEVAWDQVVSGSLVVIDEAQNVFPVRSSAGRVPGYVAFLNTHRHKPVLIVLITQHPKLVDQAVRKLISKHQHYRRVFGGQRHISYEWDSCSENLAGMKEATKRLSSFPKKAFAAYKSAESHTKPKFSYPPFLIVPVIALAGLVYLAPGAYRLLTGQKASGQVAAVPAPGASAPVVALSGAPGIGSIPVGATGVQIAAQLARGGYPVAVAVPVSAGPGRSWPSSIAGCWIGPDECECITNGDRPRLVRDLGVMCVEIASGVLVVDPLREALKREPLPGPVAAPSGVAAPADRAASSVGVRVAGI